MTFQGRINAICGPNGSGKSTLIEMIRALISNRGYEEVVRLTSSKLECGYDYRGTEIKSIWPLDEQITQDIELLFIKPSFMAPRFQEKLRTTPDLEDILETIGKGQFSDEELSDISYLVGREYRYVYFYEIEEIYEEEVVPHFVVSTNGIEYSSQSMGLGEFSLFLIYWALRSCQKQSFVLIEEPESFVSPRSQGRLADVFAQFCSEKNLWMLITTHSGFFLDPIPNGQIAVMKPEGAQFAVTADEHGDRYMRALGLRPCRQGLVFVEDRGARCFLASLLSVTCASLLEFIQIVHLRGESEVISAIKLMPRQGLDLDVVGILDGDQRGKVEGHDPDAMFPLFFLPGEGSPEVVVKQFATQSPDIVAHVLGRPVGDVHEALGAIAGLDPHDWLEEFGKQVNREYSDAMRVMVEAWLSDSENRLSADQLTHDVANALR